MANTDYSFIDRLLHRVALGSPRLGRLWFDMEEGRASKAGNCDIDRPVFIAGMARSGSTILLNALYNTGAFRSLTYRDMPFILMSGTWQSMSGGSQAQAEKKERAHGDRLLVDYDSPEAFEEVFWRTFLGDAYIRGDSVTSHDVPQAVQARFRQFMRHVLLSGDGQKRYLAKNNNDLLRLAGIRAAQPDAILLIPFRDPLQQARSLQNQHTKFCDKHAQDRFAMQYMNWLGHFEFGLGHKQYIYSTAANPHDPAGVDYWLFCWREAYEYALANAPAGAIFVGYEALCEQPLAGFTQLLPLLGLDSDPAVAADFYAGADTKDAPDCDGDLLAACLATHDKLDTLHLQPVDG